VDAENHFVIWVVLPAVTGEIFVGIGVEAADGFEIANRRSEVSVGRETSARFPEKADGAVEGEGIIDERSGRQDEK